MASLQVGQHFVRFYKSWNYQILPPGSLLDPATPMTFVGSAGLTQIETGIEHGQDHGGERYVLVQPCFRHFDIEKVGHSPVHLSLFEMGGAFAFGRVAREETLEKLWRFLIDDLELDAGRLWVTHFIGGTLEGHPFEPDALTLKTWQSLGVPAARRIGVGVEAGFWKQGGGLTGRDRLRKCGPTTEIFFDRGIDLRCGSECHPGCACGRFIEIANVLFIHAYIDQVSNTLHPLATPFDESVIGVERLAMAVQARASVFDLDCFIPPMQFVAAYTRASPTEEAARIELCVIADHIRALLFLTADGAPPPGKGGRARIMRLLIRGILTSQKILGITATDFIPDLAAFALDFYGRSFPHLITARQRLLRYFEMERSRFEHTLDAGYRQLDRFIQQGETGELNGAQALALVKQYGFPLPLIEATLHAEGISLDRQGYREAYAEWRETVT